MIMSKFTLRINQQKYEIDVLPDTPLLWVLRDELQLTGTKFGCGKALCGACTVHLNGTAVRSCSLPVSAVANTDITTIEGLSQTGDHPVQKVWMDNNVPQCGYCQTGQIMTATALLASNPDPTGDDIDNAMAGNLCRCGTYTRIKSAIIDAAKAMKTSATFKLSDHGPER